VLKFYEKTDKEVQKAEIMISRWWVDTEETADLSDEELLSVLNDSIKQGVGFRTPTQKQNSIEAFTIVKLLPKDFRDVVVIPSALVKKVGSDFDIDKLNIYLKNIL